MFEQIKISLRRLTLESLQKITPRVHLLRAIVKICLISSFFVVKKFPHNQKENFKYKKI